MTVPEYQVHIDWDDDGTFTGTGEDVSERVDVGRSLVHVEYGRDQSRALAPTQPGLAGLDVNNETRDYTPGNTASPLYGLLGPGHRLRIQAVHASTTYPLYQGFVADYDVDPDVAEPRLHLSGIDALGRLAAVKLSTPLHHAIRTGEAIGLVLDAVGWPAADRDLDLGATTIPWWWEDGTDAAAAIDRIVQSEGPPALATVDSDGLFVFRDRHHRLQRAASLTSQVTFHCENEPVLSAQMSLDYGWSDIINDIAFDVPERQPGSAPAVVWDSDLAHSVADGETLSLTATSGDPFTGAVTPVEGTDYQLRSGTVEVSLSRTSGASVTILVKGVGGPAVIDSLQLRALPVSVARTVVVSVEDPASIQQYGRRSYPRQVPPWVNANDALAVAEVILGQRAHRLPTVTFMVKGLSDARLTQQLSRDLSDRITIDADTADLNDEFFIERISHDIDGIEHRTTFGCEQAVGQITDAFTFDVSGRGFDDGRFGLVGLDDPDAMFIFDHATQGQFDVGQFAH